MRPAPLLPVLLLLLLVACDEGADRTEPPPKPVQEQSPPATEIDRPDPADATPARPTPIAPPRRPDPEQGATLYRWYCASCHGPYGQGNSINAHHFLPGLQWSDFSRPDYFEEHGQERIETAIVDGGRAVPDGSPWMPPFGRNLSEEALADLLAFLRVLPRRPRPHLPNLTPDPQPSCGSCHRVEGTELIRQSNCAGCHEIEGYDRREIAPDLSGVGRKFDRQFLYAFFRKPFNRRGPGYRPLELVRMPDFNLTVEERIDLTEYLATRVDLDLPHRYEPPDLEPDVLEQKAEETIERHACRSCHKLGSSGGKIAPDLTGIGGGRWRPEWVYNWILDPLRTYPESPMPDLGLEPEEAQILTAFLTSDRSETTATGESAEHGQEGEKAGSDPPYPDLKEPQRQQRAQRGKHLLTRLGCRGCHELDGIPFDPERDRVGPKLDMAGHRLDPDWTFDFLEAPMKIRPDLGPARMPRMRFTLEEVASAVGVLEAHARDRWGALEKETVALLATRSEEPDPAAGRRAFIDRDCHSCHQVGGETFPPVADPYFPPVETARRRAWAPDLALGRIERWWAYRWLEDPERFHEESLMPRIGLEREEIERILDYLEEVSR